MIFLFKELLLLSVWIVFSRRLRYKPDWKVVYYERIKLSFVCRKEKKCSLLHLVMNIKAKSSLFCNRKQPLTYTVRPLKYRMRVTVLKELDDIVPTKILTTCQKLRRHLLLKGCQVLSLFPFYFTTRIFSPKCTFADFQ